MPRRTVLIATVAALCTAVGSCSDSPPAQPVSTATVLQPSTTTRPNDGVLTIGVLKPSDAGGTELGQAIDDAARLAVRDINVAGGVNRSPVQLIIRDEGDNAGATQLAIDELLAGGADAIIGPASSNRALAELGHIVDAGVVACSPSATALALDKFPDQGLFFRTVPSDSLQAKAIAQAVDRTGAAATVIVHLDDAYGRPLADAVGSALSAAGITVVGSIPYAGDEPSIEAAASAVGANDPAVVVIIGDDTAGPAVLNAIEANANVDAPTYVVNDALRRPAATAQPFAASVAARIVGVAPLATPPDQLLQSLREINPNSRGIYATNTYDCVNLVALAAQTAATDGPVSIASRISAVTVGGSRCVSFADCARALEAGRNIDYDGPGGALALGPSGDPIVAAFELFGFDDNGRDTPTGRLVVGTV